MEPLLTMEEDQSRKGWALRLKEDEKDDTVVEGLKNLHDWNYGNLLFLKKILLGFEGETLLHLQPYITRT